EQDGFSKTANDLYTITTKIKQQHPDTPVFLIGHSMGSFLVRHYIQMYSTEVEGVILCGTGYASKPLMSIAKSISNIFPKEKQSPIMNQLIFGNFNKYTTEKNTTFDWLSRDQQAVEADTNDDYCGFIPTGRLFFDLMTGLQYIHSGKYNKQIRNDLPIFIMSGDADPVGPYEKGVWKAARLYEEAGLDTIKVQLYNGSRHELQHETNKDE